MKILFVAVCFLLGLVIGYGILFLLIWAIVHGLHMAFNFDYSMNMIAGLALAVIAFNIMRNFDKIAERTGKHAKN